MELPNKPIKDYTEEEKKAIYDHLANAEAVFFKKLREKMQELAKDEKLKKEMQDSIAQRLNGKN